MIVHLQNPGVTPRTDSQLQAHNTHKTRLALRREFFLVNNMSFKNIHVSLGQEKEQTPKTQVKKR